MLIRLPHWGLALLAAGTLWPMSAGLAQDTSDPQAPAKVPSTPEEKANALQDTIEDRSVDKRTREPRPHKIHDADPFKKHPPVWSIRDVTKDYHPYAHPSAPAPGGGHFPGGPTGRFGQPYYYTAITPDTSGTGGGGPGIAAGAQPMGGYGGFGHYPATGGYPIIDGSMGGPGGYVDPGYVDPGYGGGYGMGIGGGGYGAGFGPGPAQAMMAPGMVGPGYGAGFAGGYGGGFVGGYGAGYGGGYGGGPAGGFGSPNFAAMPGQLPGDPYYYHFGPGFYRQQEAGHYRFPYYSYRRPWYFPGHTSYNRDTNIPW